MANTAPISSSSSAGPSAVRDSDGSSSAGAVPLLARHRTALCIHTLSEYYPLYSTRQDARIACHHNCTVHLSVRPHSRTVRTAELKRALLFSFVRRVRTCRRPCLFSFYFHSGRKRICSSTKLHVVQVPSTSLQRPFNVAL